MSARAGLVVPLGLAMAFALAGCSLFGQQPSAESGVASNTVEPTRSVEATVATSSVDTTIASDGSKDVVTTIKASDELSTMGELLDAAGMAKPIGTGKGPYTVFVPTNAAFAKLPAEWLPKLKDPASIEKLRRLLRYHLVRDRIGSEQMFNIRRMMTYEGGVLKITRKGPVGYVNGDVRIIQGDVRGSNGLIYLVDTVMVPPGFKP